MFVYKLILTVKLSSPEVFLAIQTLGNGALGHLDSSNF